MGWLAVAHYLRQQLPAEHGISVVEKRDTFSFCPAYLWLMTDERAGVADVESPKSSLARRQIERVHEEVVGIDPEAISVTTSPGTFEADCIVVALGAEASRRGQIAVLIARTPFRCPAVPYEAAFLDRRNTTGPRHLRPALGSKRRRLLVADVDNPKAVFGGASQDRPHVAAVQGKDVGCACPLQSGSDQIPGIADVSHGASARPRRDSIADPESVLT